MDQEVPEKYLSVLKKYFGYREFRPMQWKIVNSILNEQKDNCVIMATGYGKSLCYQYPPVFKNGVGVVISPLISLMQDQVLALKVKNIPATLMGSAQKEKGATMEDVKNGKFRLVYVTPEWCSTDCGLQLLKDLSWSKTVNLTLVAIDEAHCVSQWGMDFRKSYRKLGELKSHLRGVPFLALTATATPTVQKDICLSLRLSSPRVTLTSFDRPNLFLSCSVKGADILSDIKLMLNAQRNNLAHIAKGSCIIYCPTKKKVDEVAEVLSGDGIRCEMYHADLSMTVRERVHKDFVRDKIQIVVATVAFGMGIDKPDVRRIIHYGAPIDIETYYQEIGRAGRDGEQSHCHVFYNQSDFGVAKHFLSTLSPEYRSYKEGMTRIMQRYLQTSDCRRKILVSHFDPDAQLESNAKCCDNCLKSLEKSDPRIKVDLDYDLTEDALLLLKAIRETRGFYGLQVPIYLVRGSRCKKLPEKYHDTELFAKGYDKPEEYWKLLGGLLLREFLLEDRYVNAKGSFGGFPLKTVQVSNTGHDYINNPNYRKSYSLKPTPEMLPHIIRLNRSKHVVRPGTWLGVPGSVDTDSTDGQKPQSISIEELVFDAMLKFRTTVASQLDCMPYMIFDNHTIQLLSQSPPTTLEELSKVDGFTEAKIEKFGAACLQSIAAAKTQHEVLLNKNTEGNVKQFTKAKKVFKYESDDSDSEDTKTSNTAPSSLPLAKEVSNKQAESKSVAIFDDSFADDDIFEGLANDEELIASSTGLSSPKVDRLASSTLQKLVETAKSSSSDLPKLVETAKSSSSAQPKLVETSEPAVDQMDSQLCAEFESDFPQTPKIERSDASCAVADQATAATLEIIDATLSSEFETDYFTCTSSNSESNPTPRKVPLESPFSLESSKITRNISPKLGSPTRNSPNKPESKFEPNRDVHDSPDSPPKKRVKNSASAPHYQPLNIPMTSASAVIKKEHIQKNQMKKSSLLKKIKL